MHFFAPHPVCAVNQATRSISLYLFALFYYVIIELLFYKSEVSMSIDIAEIFAQQMRDEEKQYKGQVTDEEISKQLKESIKGMKDCLKGKNPDYTKIKMKIYRAKP
jgi:hypothetical protein